MSTPLPIVRTTQALRQQIKAWRRDGDLIALVPTMGALHEGHLDLVRLALRQSKRVVVSIFVNPTQFAPTEDLSRYPRDEAGDAEKLARTGCSLIWAPTPDIMYPSGFATRIIPAGVADGLETDTRPQFFGGVATVCCKLFSQVTPDIAVFGEKDYQQLCVVQQMVRDLDLPLGIVAAPTTREADGLAMSSRNAYLSPDQRTAAPALFRIMTELASQLKAGGSIHDVTTAARQQLNAAGFAKIDYVEIRNAKTLAPPIAGTDVPLRLLVAAWLGTTRLIDNITL
jgi:pantoate--beta-alanine ligase